VANARRQAHSDPMADTPKTEMTDALRRIAEPGMMFDGSRDFLLAYRLLGRQRAQALARPGTVPSPWQSWIVCASLALELALKCRIVLDGGDAPKTHSYVKLFAELSPAAKRDLASRVPFREGQSTVERVAALLANFKNPFETFRYMHELIAKTEPAAFYEGDMMTVIRALYLSILSLREDFRRFRGMNWNPAAFDDTGMPLWP
jgi:hypothetical protein